VAPLGMGEAMRRAGACETTVRQAEGLLALLDEQPDEARKVALLQALLRPEAAAATLGPQTTGTCAQCSRRDVAGRLGTGEYDGQFFCGACWEVWSHLPVRGQVA